jgi:hypothetical protein
MALDFAVLTEDGKSADFVSLEMEQHDELMNLAERLKLSKLLCFEDYFEEVDLRVSELGELSEELSILSKSAPPQEIAKFAHDLRALIALAVNRRQPLSAVPD